MAKFSVGQVWRGKRPAHSNGFVNDRVITYVSPVGRIQYDGPTVNLGRRLPIVEAEVFEKWAGREVGNELPEGATLVRLQAGEARHGGNRRRG